MGKIVPFEQLSEIRKAHQAQRIVHCHGVFDLFHFGHLAHLKSAKKFGDILVVTITPDQFVNKGPGRPYYSEHKRAVMLASLEMVDYVSINRFPKAVEPIRALGPDFYVKGPDYRNKSADITGGIQEEEDAVRAAGGDIAFTEDETDSSTELLNKYFSQWDENQSQTIELLKAGTSLQELISLIEKMSSLKVLVVGEPIIDTYVFCNAQGISTKSPTVSAGYMNQEDYAGGSLAIANHLAALGCQTSLLFTHGGEPYFRDMVQTSIAKSVKIFEHVLEGTSTARKTRYLVPFRAQRIFELTDLRYDQWSQHDPQPFIDDLLKLAKQHDLIVLADFGHGLFEASVLEALQGIDTFIAVNVQTNSSNHGFNLFNKHKRFDYVALDERETRLALHDRFSPPQKLAMDFALRNNKTPASITLGTAGSLYLDKTQALHSCPSFFKKVVDTTGAGDAYFAITSVLEKMGASPATIPFVGNCHAGLKAQILGNKDSVSKIDLIRTLQSILK